MVLVSQQQLKRFKTLTHKYNVDITKVDESTSRKIALAVKNNKWNVLENLLQKVGA